jgi:hypothetical protein
MPSDDGRKLLRDLASKVRTQTDTSGNARVEQLGADTIEQLIAEVTGADGMPGLNAFRDRPDRIRLRRQGRPGQIILELDRPTVSIVVTFEKFNARTRQVRYIHDDGADSWHPLDGGGELWTDIAAGLVDCLYPEGKR